MRAICFCSPAPPAFVTRTATLGVARQLFETIIGNLPAEIFAGDVLDFVRFIENHRAVFGKHAAEIILLQREIGEK